MSANNIDTPKAPCGAQDDHMVLGAVAVVDAAAGVTAIAVEKTILRVLN